ncbi:hypothetical protein SYNPS1DRAFT_23028 [Syncephalis pseudoplumigaleata]|uniref:Up-regulated during septation protein 1 domain-containing protein n=1 Tax=Syncephalis pseudoplumigaleata TaxID=1712513 RepID=A0A4P9YYA9_9FUNG|nr:hypothetical protein SYNPS1DRAFT_23028 [Syncephalis pseudoplumigaleata]|eukprot:RKP24938.1 hypothetical protein SYNPS1DRAFT_23028 [Syncephalis pseudoplumigaleata]
MEANSDGDIYSTLTPEEIGRLYAKVTADSAKYRLLQPGEHRQLCRQIESLERSAERLADRLAVETRIRDGALSLYRLHGANKKMAARIKEQYRTVSRSVDQLCLELWRQTRRAWRARQSLLEHQVRMAVHVADELESAWHALHRARGSVLTEDEAAEMVAMLKKQQQQLKHANSALLTSSGRIHELELELEMRRSMQEAASFADGNTRDISWMAVNQLQRELDEAREREACYIQIIQQQQQGDAHTPRAASPSSSGDDGMLDSLVSHARMSIESAQAIRELEQQLGRISAEASHYQSRVAEYESVIGNLIDD